MKKITREINSTEIVYMVVDKESAEVGNFKLALEGDYPGEAKALRKVKDYLPDSVAPVCVVSHNAKTCKYSMPVEKFMELAEKEEN